MAFVSPTKINTTINIPFPNSYDSFLLQLKKGRCKILSVNKLNGTVCFKTPITMTDWGVTFDLTFQDDSAMRTIITGIGKPVWGYTNVSRKITALLNNIH